MMENYLISSVVADVLSISKTTLRQWEKSKKLLPVEIKGSKFYQEKDLLVFPEFCRMQESLWDDELQTKPLRKYQCIELFAGAGGLAIGLEKAGFSAVLLNEIDKSACKTLRKNRPLWNIQEGDVSQLDFTEYRGKVDLVSGGFPCQAFSYAGKKLGFEDARGTLFYEFARCLKEVSPPVFLAENVRGLLNHDNGKTIESIKNIIADIGYELIEPRILKAIFYQVPQKRERLFLIGIRKDLLKYIHHYQWPSPYKRVMILRDALKKGLLYPDDVPPSLGQHYPERKREILSHVPQGGYWRDLPLVLQKEYMKGSFYLGGGKTGMARRLSWDEPSLTLTCSPAQKQTERCHPEETRPLTVREYARIQTFPDQWHFEGALTNIYKQIGNAVPVNLGYAVARSLVRLLNEMEDD